MDLNNIKWTLEIENSFPKWKTKNQLLLELNESLEKYLKAKSDIYEAEVERLNRINILQILIKKYDNN